MNGRPSSFRIAIRQFWLLFGSIWLLVGSVFLVVGGGFAWKDYRYRTEGVRTEAEVVGKDRRSGSKGGTTYFVQYRFTARDSVIYEGNDSLNFRAWDSLKDGDKVAVIYLPDKPEANRLEGSNEWLLAAIFGGLGGIFGPIGGALVVRGILKVRRTLRLMSEGVRVDAKMLEVKASNITLNNVRQWFVRYAYTDMMGQRHEAKSDYMSPEEAHRWNEGDTGVVRYDQNQPEVSIWVGREDAL